jgi:hypothetical protein
MMIVTFGMIRSNDMKGEKLVKMIGIALAFSVVLAGCSAWRSSQEDNS